MTAIDNYTTYIEGMQKSLEDKLFWVPIIEQNCEILKDEKIDGIVDFGCADGTLLKQVKHDLYYASDYRQKDINLIGVDNNNKMLDRALSNCLTMQAVGSLDEVEVKENYLLNLSSVIHEVYSYCSDEEIEDFWNHVFNDNYKYIAIRDMMVDRSVNLVNPIVVERQDGIHLLRKEYWNKYYNNIHEFDTKQWKNFLVHSGYDADECSWNVENKDVLHFLMKYRYIENWEREVRENYFPIYYEDLLNKIIENGNYEIVYARQYILPYVKEKVKEDFDIDLVDNTHCQILLKWID